MNKKIIPVLLLALSGLCASAQNLSSSTIFGFLNTENDARGLGLAGASLTLENDSDASLNNPSNMSFYDSNAAASLTYYRLRPGLSKDISAFNFSGFYKIGTKHSAGILLKHLRKPEIKPAYSSAATYQPRELAVGLAYSYLADEHLSFGAKALFAKSYIAKDYSVSAPMLGLSAMYRNSYPASLGEKDLSLDWSSALDFSNIGPGKNMGGTSYPMPFSAQFENRLTVKGIENHSLAAVLNLRYNRVAHSQRSKDISAALGLEYTAFDILSLRAGYVKANENVGKYSYMTGGIGFHYKFAALDFAYIFAGKDTPMNRAFCLSLSFMF